MVIGISVLIYGLGSHSNQPIKRIPPAARSLILLMNSGHMTLSDFLAQQGFRQIALSRSGVGHFHTAGSLNGHSVPVLIDTGAASTVVSLERARQIGLTLKKLEMKGGGAGGAQLDIFQLPDATLSLGDMQLRCRALFGMDLAHVNQSLALKGQSPVDVILGADVFEAHAAVIDYGSSSLFLEV
jgi:clan AA aspartic protease (TIGR02281 family)